MKKLAFDIILLKANFPAVFCPLFTVLFFFDNPFSYKPVGFYHCRVNGSVGFISGGDDDLLYFSDVLSRGLTSKLHGAADTIERTISLIRRKGLYSSSFL